MNRETRLERLHQMALDQPGELAQESIILCDRSIESSHWARSSGLDGAAADTLLRRRGAREETLGRLAVVLFSPAGGSEIGDKYTGGGLADRPIPAQHSDGTSRWLYPVIGLNIDPAVTEHPERRYDMLNSTLRHELAHCTQRSSSRPLYARWPGRLMLAKVVFHTFSLAEWDADWAARRNRDITPLFAHKSRD